MNSQKLKGEFWSDDMNTVSQHIIHFEIFSKLKCLGTPGLCSILKSAAASESESVCLVELAH